MRRPQSLDALASYALVPDFGLWPALLSSGSVNVMYLCANLRIVILEWER